ncbi:MAG: hypothetical protein HKN16_11125, partial [Saprospiraceae bacterium]|nr:hypothetical protein [Saprospiraceae bacterium]
LRAAIEEANALAGLDTIKFSIGSGSQTISPNGIPGAYPNGTGLDYIVDPVIIDATSQPGYSGSPLITIDGTNATSTSGALILRTDSSTIKGFIVVNFTDEGLEIDGSTGYGDYNIIEENWVGIDALGNPGGVTDNGILVTENADGNIVRNNLSGSNSNNGILVRNSGSNDNWVYGNIVGSTADLNNPRGNNSHGIIIQGDASNNIIGSNGDGSDDATEKNIILNNTNAGLAVLTTSGTSNAFLRNEFFENGGLAIDLNNDGVSTNDLGDGDTGPNNLQNYPVLTSAKMDISPSITIDGTLNSIADTTFRIEFYANSTEDGTGFGEGETYLGATSVTTNGSGDASFSTPLTGSLPLGTFVSATATIDHGGGSFGSTSELAENISPYLALFDSNQVTGYVFRDVDSDATFAFPDNGHTGITVRLYDDIDDDGVLDGTDTLLQSTTTDANGAYLFALDNDYSGGDFHYIINTNLASYPGGSILTTDNAETAYFSAAGQNDTENNFGFQVASTISGTVFKDLNSDTLNSAGDPGANAVDVILYEDVNGDGLVDGGDSPIDTTTTPVNGIFSFTVYPQLVKMDSTFLQVNAGTDDAEEMLVGCAECDGPDTNAGCITHDGGALDVGTVACGGEVIGIRFNNVGIPQGATIIDARFTFTGTTNSESSTTHMTIRAEATDSASTYALNSYEISGRNQTTDSVDWNYVSTWNQNVEDTSPDISKIIQEVVDRPGWDSDNSMAFVITGFGERSIRSYNGSTTMAPKLAIYYTTPDTANYVIQPDVLTLPIGANYTTDDVESAQISSVGQNDSGNDFGIANEHLISGYVFEDTNTNGIKEIGETGQSGITVDLYEDVNQDGLKDAGDILKNSFPTVVDGYYSFLVYPGTINNVSKMIDASANDAEENVNTGSMLLTGMDMDFTYDKVFAQHQIMGLRFTGMNIPQGANIISARIDFRANTNGNDPLDVEIYGEAIDNAPIFTTAAYNISSRTLTNSNVQWDNVPNWFANSIHSSPDIAHIVSEIVNRPGWSSGNSMVFSFFGDVLGERAAKSWNNNSSQAPRLVVSYSDPNYPEHYVVHVDSTSLPLGMNFTTDNYEPAVFSAPMEVDTFNNFGYEEIFMVDAGSDVTICEGQSTTLTATEANGAPTVTYSWDNGLGAGVSHVVSPTTTTKYKVTGTDGLSNTYVDSVTVTVNPKPSVGLVLGDDSECVSSTTLALTGGTPAGGTYSGVGVTGTNFNASVAGAGSHIINYTYTDGNGCTDSAVDVITVHSLPFVSYFISGDDMACENDGLVNIQGGSPAGGTYSGPGVTGSQID